MRQILSGKLSEKIIDIEFSYNGNLGTLQTITKVNAETCHAMLKEGLIDNQEHDETLNRIHDYFTKQMKYAINNGSITYMI